MCRRGRCWSSSRRTARNCPRVACLAREGEKGIQEKVLGEGWHYVTPIVYTTEQHPNVTIRPGHVGIVTAQGGDLPADGRVLAEKDTEKGIRRDVLAARLVSAQSLRLQGRGSGGGPHRAGQDRRDAPPAGPGRSGSLRPQPGREGHSPRGASAGHVLRQHQGVRGHPLRGRHLPDHLSLRASTAEKHSHLVPGPRRQHHQHGLHHRMGGQARRLA